MAKRFFFTALGILALAAAYHLGAVRTEAQSGGQFAGIALDFNGTPYAAAITTAGDVYVRKGWPSCDGTWGGNGSCEWIYSGNVVSGPTPIEAHSFGSVKDMFRK